jgi:hypothetical protein
MSLSILEIVEIIKITLLYLEIVENEFICFRTCRKYFICLENLENLFISFRNCRKYFNSYKNSKTYLYVLDT